MATIPFERVLGLLNADDDNSKCGFLAVRYSCWP